MYCNYIILKYSNIVSELIIVNYGDGLYFGMLTLTLLWATIVAQKKPSAACCGRLYRRVN